MDLKKYGPVLLGVVVVLGVAAIIVNVSRKPAAGPGKAAVSKPLTDAAKKKKVSAMMKQAQAAYDAKNYKASFDQTTKILTAVDNMSQEAKNLRQLSQLRMIEMSRPAAAAVPAPVVPVAPPADAVKAVKAAAEAPAAAAGQAAAPAA